jgi:hypothetical protein
VEKDKVLELSNFRNIFGIKDFGHENLRFFFVFIFANAPCAAPFDWRLPLA